MQQIWLFHINPQSRYGYKYGWDVERPATILNSADRTWSSGRRSKSVKIGDIICVYMKKMSDKPSGVHIVGKVTDIAPGDREFTWRPDVRASARTLKFPINTETIRKFFPRSYGDSIQLLDVRKQRKWRSHLGLGQ